VSTTARLLGVNWLGVNWLGVNWLGVNWLGAIWLGVNWLGAIWLLALSLCVVFPTHVSSAAPESLQELKQAGQVGEQVDGYVGIVGSDLDEQGRALVDRINAERMAAYARIAEAEGVAVEQVAALAGAKLVEGAPSGQYVRDSTGAWKQK
jgi:hypothetical protein